MVLDKQAMARLQRALHPSVFDSLDIHVDKLNVLTHSYAKDQDQSELICQVKCVYGSCHILMGNLNVLNCSLQLRKSSRSGQVDLSERNQWGTGRGGH